MQCAVDDPRSLLRRATACLLAALVMAGCSSDPSSESTHLFELLAKDKTGISFENRIHYQYEFNIYRYRNFYNGGGIGIADVDNDGLNDVYIVGNQVENRLFINKGDWDFSDVTTTAGVAGAKEWSTGVTMADVNADGWVDIYVCNSGIVEGDDKKNELFINNKDGTFTEMASEYGLADSGLSIHASFFDYDRDGDLDLYLVNNSFRSIGSFNLEENTRHVRHWSGGDRLYENTLISDGARSEASVARFIDVSAEAGILGSEIGFGLGASIGDVNRDGWPDIYVSNDFFERDYLYLNAQDGTFDEVLEQSIKSVSAAAMGADMADLNADGYPDLFVTDMLPSDERRLKTVTSFDNWERYQNYIADDYYHQFTRNALQLNRGRQIPVQRASADGRESAPPVYFSEIGRLSGVEATDWSWGAMIADYDLDGFRDLFVANGIFQDLTNADYLVEIRDENTMRELIKDRRVDYETLIDMIPSNPISNHMFAGSAQLRFADVTDSWGLSEPSFSNGSAYGDLDNDGDLDLVVNNVNMEVFVYRNRATDLYPDRAWLRIDLRGRTPNKYAVGAQLTAWSGGRQWYVEQQPIRGFQSTVDHTLHLGLGAQIPSGRLDSLVIHWTDGAVTSVRDVATNQRLEMRHPEAGKSSDSAEIVAVSDTQSSMGTIRHGRDGVVPSPGNGKALESLDASELGLDWQHRENVHDDFTRQPLLFHMLSTEGPALCAGDANGDRLADLYLGGAKDQPGVIFLQTRGGQFRRFEQPALDSDRVSEDTECIWLDIDGDGDSDLFVGSGGSELPPSSSALMDRLYVNDGRGNLRRSDQQLISASAGFEPAGAAAAVDFDDDGDLDLFIGARAQAFAYGIPSDGHLLANDGSGVFEEVTDSKAAGLRDLGMITDAKWGDVDGDGDPDLVIAGEWMPLTLFENRDGNLVNQTSEAGLSGTDGWWNAVELEDLDGDGDLDIIGANHGLNSRFQADPENPVEMWTSDFDGNGRVEQIVATYKEGKPYPLALRHDLLDQLPYLEDKYPTYASYAGQSVHDIFTDEQLEAAVHRQVVQLQSIVAWNDGSGRFGIEPMPFEVQLSPMYGIAVADVNSDGTREVLMGGNLYEAKPQVGRYDASFGAVTEIAASGMQSLTPSQTGFWVDGPVRGLQFIRTGDRRLLIVARNNDSLSVFSEAD